MELQCDVHEATRALSKADADLAKVIDQFGPCTMTIRSINGPFEALFRSIIFQQLSTQSATAIHGRAIGLYDNNLPTPKQTLQIEDEAFRSVGMSRQKIKYTRDLAAKSIEGVVPEMSQLHKLSDQEIIERLTQVHGIGRWTVEMLLMFSMGRPDVLPSTDLAIRKGFQQVYNFTDLPKPKEIDQYGTRWQPYRTIASWYLWRVVDGDNDEW